MSQRLTRFAPFTIWPLVLAACIALPFLTRAVPLTLGIERAVHDAYRYLLADEVETDPDIVLLIYSDGVARETGRTSPVDRAMLAGALRAAQQGGAKAVAVDMIFTQRTADEGELIAALKAMEIPTYVAFADPEGDRAAYWDVSVDADARQYQQWFWSQLDGSQVRKVSPVVGVDETGVARRWPDIAEGGNPPLAGAMSGTIAQTQDYMGGIRFNRMPGKAAVDGLEEAKDMFPALETHLVSDELFAEAFLPLLVGKYVLIGSDTFNSDQLATPITRIGDAPKVAGVTVHAQMLRQALEREFPPALSPWLVAGLALLMALLGASTAAIERRPVLLVLAILAQAAALLALPFGVERLGYDIVSLPPFGLLLTWLLAFLTVGYALRNRTSAERAFARDALGKFLPASVAREILAHPEKLTLEGEERPLFLMFTDLEGFTKYSHGRAPQEVAMLLNQYLEEMSRIILAHHGTLDKFVGDAIVAFWGAPLEDEADGARAVACALALHEASERLRAEAGKLGETFGRTRIGLHYGPVVVGNFGGASRIQYTALGDAMNTAARLEGANKYLKSDILVSGAIARMAPDFTYRPLGWITLSGVGEPIEVLEPVQGARADYAGEIAAAMQAGDAPARLAQLAASHDDDPALAELARRSETVTRERPYVLGSK